MRTYKELEELRESLNSDYSTMLKNKLMNQEEFNICIKGMSLKIKENQKGRFN